MTITEEEGEIDILARSGVWLGDFCAPRNFVKATCSAFQPVLEECVHSVSTTNGEVTYETMGASPPRARQEDVRCIYDQKCNEAAMAETNCTNAIHVVFGKAEALEKHVKTVSVRADSLLTTESDSIPTILETT